MRNYILTLLIALCLSCGGEDSSEELNTSSSVLDVSSGAGDEDSDEGDDVLLEENCPLERGECSGPVPSAASLGFRIHQLALGTTGLDGDALNVDPEAGPEDCSPAASCENGNDNAMSPLAGFANDGLVNALDVGNLMIVGEVVGDTTSEFLLNLYTGVPEDDTCAFQTDACTYSAAPSSYGCDCSIRSTMVATITDGTLVAGGDEGTFAFLFPIDQEVLDLTTVRARLTAEVTETEDGWELTNLIIGGAIARETLVQTINEHPADQFGAVAKSTVVQVIESIPLDIDTDGDGELDGISVGMKGAAIPASFVEN